MLRERVWRYIDSITEALDFKYSFPLRLLSLSTNPIPPKRPGIMRGVLSLPKHGICIQCAQLSDT